MADNWLGPDTCGVKLAQFEQMTQDMTKAAPQLAELADQLWQALNGAGVSTAPAMEIKRIAAWAQEAAADLRRRNVLVHDLDRQKFAFQVCRPDGTYITLPDRYTDQVAFGEGRRLAALVQRAAAGDRKALEQLRRLAPGDVEPALAKALIQSLGADGLLEVTSELSRRLGLGIHQDGGDALARDTRNVLALLGRSLALSTTPGRSGYVGDDYFGQLITAARATFPPDTKPPQGRAGYQSLSTLIAAAGGTRFSARFFQTVGSDMIGYDRGLNKLIGPLPDLSGHYDLGNALDPGTTKVTPGDRKSDFLIPLLNAAAASGREGAQALLNHRPTGPHQADTSTYTKLPNLEYLLRDRRALWGQSDHGAALGAALKTAASGLDKESQRLAFEAARILATDARKYYVVKGDKIVPVDESGIGNLLRATTSLGEPAQALQYYGRVFNPIQGVDALSALRPHMAEVIAAHIGKVNDALRVQQLGMTSSYGLTDADLDYLFLDLTRDAGSFEILLRGQIAHAGTSIHQAIANRSKHLDSVITAEAWMFGHLLEARNQALEGNEAKLAEELARVQSYVGLFTGVATQQAQAAVARRAPVAGEAANLLVPQVQAALTKMIAQGLVDKADDAVVTPTTNAEAVEKLFNQMVVSSLVTTGRYDPKDLEGKSFATAGANPKIRPLESLDHLALEDLLRWANNQMGSNAYIGDVKQGLRDGRVDTSGHFKDSNGKNVPPSFQR